jgi:UDP-glucose:(heptosyl)LPS alpha-1,3-glucosyltransferase
MARIIALVRIGIQTEHFDPVKGGAETYVFRLVHHLLEEGHEVHIFSSAKHTALNATMHRVSPYRPDVVQAAVRTVPLDVVLGSGKCLGMNVFQPHHGTFIGTFRQNIALVRNAGLRRAVASLNRMNPKYLAACRLERRQFGQRLPRPHIVALSQMVRADMLKHYEVSPERVHLLYNGVDLESFSPARCSALRASARRELGLSDATVCYTLVAHNYRLKGLRELIDALPLVQRQHGDIRVLVAGRGPSLPYTLQASRLGCRRVLQFAGVMKDVVRAYAATDVYVHPTWYDPCSLTVLEALACGLPVITTRFNGAGELIEDAQQGFVIDAPSDRAQLAARMIELLDGSTRQRMGGLARGLAEQHSSDENFRQLTAILKLAASESRPMA